MTQTANRLFAAGQIPLLPSTLTLPSLPPSSPDHGFAHAAALAMQHVHRIAAASLPARGRAHRKEGGVLWLAPVRDEDEWRRRGAAGAAVWRAAAARALDEDEEHEEHEEGEDETDLEHPSDDEAVPPLVVVEAAALPRGASVEWQVTYSGGGVRVEDWEGEGSSDEEGEGRAGERAAEEKRREEDGRCVRMETGASLFPSVFLDAAATLCSSSTS